MLVVLSVTLLVLWLTDTGLPPAGTGAVAGAAVSGIVAIALAALGYAERRADSQERQRERTEGFVIQSFQYFTGGTQERGVRISAVEGLLFQVPRLRGVFVPLLVNQVIYVLTKVPESSSKERSEGPETGEREAGNKPLTDHEKDNLNRMIALLAELRRRDPNHEREYTNLAAKIREKCKRVEGETKARLELQLARLDGR